MLRLLHRNASSVSLIRRSLASSHPSTFRELHGSSRVQALSKFTMPAMSPTMTEGGISNWKKKEGENFSVGDVLLEIETDKATMDVEAQDDGKIAKIIVGDGSKAVPVGKAIAILAEEGEEVDSSALEKLVSESESSEAAAPKEAPASASSSASAPPKTEPKQESSKQPTAPSSSSTPKPSSSPPRAAIFATPAAKRVALEKGIPLGSIKGSGPNGRILESDLASYTKASSGSSSSTAPVGASYDDLPVSNMRRTIASRLTASKQEVPHYYLTSEIRMERVNRLRALFNTAALERAASEKAAGLQAPTKLSVNDFVIKACALACTDVPEVNSSWHGDFVRQNKTVDISVAVATPTGLITPIVTNVASRGLGSISAEIRALATKAKANQLSPHEYQGGTFTVSNLGMFGSVSQFTAIINSPQSCILAVGGTEKKVVVDEEKSCSEGAGGIGFKEVETVKVTLSCDHRVVDGAVGARWLKAFKGYMENPLSFML